MTKKPTDKLLAEWFWTDRWMGSRAFLMPIEVRGFYREMLTQAWRRGAQLPNDHEAIQRAIGATSKEWDRCWPKVKQFWRVEGDVLVNDTQVEIYREAKERQSVTVDRAKRGAQARWKQSESNPQAQAGAHPQERANGHAQALPEECAPSPSPSPSLQEEKASGFAAKSPVENSEDAKPTDGLLRKLAYQVIDANPEAEFADLKEELKKTCARIVPGHYSADVVGQSLEDALRVRDLHAVKARVGAQ